MNKGVLDDIYFSQEDNSKMKESQNSKQTNKMQKPPNPDLNLPPMSTFKL